MGQFAICGMGQIRPANYFGCPYFDPHKFDAVEFMYIDRKAMIECHKKDWE